MAKDSASKKNIWKWIILAFIASLSFYICNPPSQKIRLGLDLKGGTSLILRVDENSLKEIMFDKEPALTNQTEAAVNELVRSKIESSQDSVIQTIRRRVDAMGTNEPVIQSMDDNRVLVQLPGMDDESSKIAKARLQSSALLTFRLVHPVNDRKVKEILGKNSAPEGYVKSGSGYVRADDYDQIAKSSNHVAKVARWETGGTGRYRFMLMKSEEKDGAGKAIYRPYFIDRKVQIDGSSLKNASVEFDNVKNEYCVSFLFDEAGGNEFSKITRKNIGKQLAIILDDELISAPVIQSEIGQQGQITGNFTSQEAHRLASDLNSGALPAPLTILAETKVAPTVGEDAIAAGKVAAVTGFMLIALFMIVYYWYAGFVANIALFLDVVLLPTALVLVSNVLGVFGGVGDSAASAMQLPVLTMPGIAGLVLSLGMAVDANVLIFERVREEFLAGRAAGKAIENGYGRAFTAILDSNLTTIIIGIILFVVGTGPVRGFAVMLTAGVLISMFTAVVVTRLVFDHTVDGGRTKPLKMLNLFKNPKFDFMKYTKFTVFASLAVIVVGLGIFGFRLADNRASVLAVDLTGGTSITYDLNQDKAVRPAVSDVRSLFNEFDNAAVIQYQEGLESDTLLVKTGETSETKKGSQLENKDVEAHLTKLLQEKFPAAEFKVKSVDEVGSMVGNDLKVSGIKAVIFSLIAILVYIGFRFNFGFGLGGVVALAHDALISLAIFSLCGRQVSLIVITALLTIIGYSINDTVVVFDRIREMLRRDSKLSFKEICNLAVNQCLSRTVITSLTTFFAVLALFAFGDGSIFDFALTMLIGIIAGTYSSVFIATPVMLWWYRGKRPEFDKETKSAA